MNNYAKGMAWLILILAGLTEIIWVVSLKFAILKNSLVGYPIVFGVMVLNFWLMSIVIRTIPIGTAYGVWVGIGTFGTALAGIVFFKEPLSPIRIFLLVLLVLALIGLRLTANESQIIP